MVKLGMELFFLTWIGMEFGKLKPKSMKKAGQLNLKYPFGTSDFHHYRIKPGASILAGLLSERRKWLTGLPGGERMEEFSGFPEQVI